MRPSPSPSSLPQPSITTLRILPRPSSTPASVETNGAEFPRLPASSLHPTTSTQTTTSRSSNEEFERLTQVVEASTERVTDHMGPKHSMEGQGGSENGKLFLYPKHYLLFTLNFSEPQPEFHTVGTAETPSITTTLITLKNATTTAGTGINPVEGQAENRTGSEAPSGNWTWIIALVIVGGKTLFFLRFL